MKDMPDDDENEVIYDFLEVMLKALQYSSINIYSWTTVLM